MTALRCGALAVARDPDAFAGGLRPEDGSDWMVAGEPWPGDNPRLTVPPAWHEVVRLWAACRDPEGGVAHWPDAGGVGDQAAWLFDAFATLGTIYAKMVESETRLRGQSVSG